MPSYFIKTYGCQANIADSQKIAATLEKLGYKKLDVPTFKSEKEETIFILKNTDVFVINSCAVRQKSEDKVYGLGKPVKEVIEKFKKKPFIVVAGCVVGGTKSCRPRGKFSDLQKKTSWADLYIGPSEIGELPKILKDHKDSSRFVKKLDKEKHTNVNISYGCDNFCTYCVVPYTRGPEISRSKKEILDEIKTSVSKGVSEITLCGQNVNSWGLSLKEKNTVRTGGKYDLPFVDLLKSVHKIMEITKIDFISSNPFDFTDDLVEALSLPKISNYIHIAIQSGNNQVLKNMNRKHTVEEFEKLIDKIKKVKPALELGTDFIVGFPGETEDQFMDTVRLVQRIKFNVAFISMYSPRKGTIAFQNFKDDVLAEEKEKARSFN